MDEIGSKEIRRNPLARFAWMSLGFASLGLGILGIFLPLLPTTPFLILAAFAFSRSSQRLHDWLTRHPRLGPPIEAWRRHGAISRTGKRLAMLAIVGVFLISILLDVQIEFLAIQGAVLLAVSTFILTRPLPPEERGEDPEQPSGST